MGASHYKVVDSSPKVNVNDSVVETRSSTPKEIKKEISNESEVLQQQVKIKDNHFQTEEKIPKKKLSLQNVFSYEIVEPTNSLIKAARDILLHENENDENLAQEKQFPKITHEIGEPANLVIEGACEILANENETTKNSQKEIQPLPTSEMLEPTTSILEPANEILADENETNKTPEQIDPSEITNVMFESKAPVSEPCNEILAHDENEDTKTPEQIDPSEITCVIPELKSTKPSVKSKKTLATKGLFISIMEQDSEVVPYGNEDTKSLSPRDIHPSEITRITPTGCENFPLERRQQVAHYLFDNPAKVEKYLEAFSLADKPMDREKVQVLFHALVCLYIRKMENSKELLMSETTAAFGEEFSDILFDLYELDDINKEEVLAFIIGPCFKSIYDAAAGNEAS